VAPARGDVRPRCRGRVADDEYRDAEHAESPRFDRGLRLTVSRCVEPVELRRYLRSSEPLSCASEGGLEVRTFKELVRSNPVHRVVLGDQRMAFALNGSHAAFVK
jgi:hypothetical protein